MISGDNAEACNELPAWRPDAILCNHQDIATYEFSARDAMRRVTLAGFRGC